jgi:hypothetical protein
MKRLPKPVDPDRNVTLNVPLPLSLHQRLQEIAKRDKRSKRLQAAYILARECGWRAGDASGQVNKAS